MSANNGGKARKFIDITVNVSSFVEFYMNTKGTSHA